MDLHCKSSRQFFFLLPLLPHFFLYRTLSLFWPKDERHNYHTFSTDSHKEHALFCTCELITKIMDLHCKSSRQFFFLLPLLPHFFLYRTLSLFWPKDERHNYHTFSTDSHKEHALFCTCELITKIMDLHCKSSRQFFFLLPLLPHFFLYRTPIYLHFWNVQTLTRPGHNTGSYAVYPTHGVRGSFNDPC